MSFQADHLQVTSPSNSRLDTQSLCVLLGAGLYLCCNLLSLGGTPFLLGGDEQVFWMNALRMQQGELIYRDFFEFTPPGTDLVYLAAFTLLGPRVWVPNVVQLLLGISLTYLCFHIARRIMKPAESVLVTALFLILKFGKWMDGTHHWFSVLAVMLAVAIAMRGSSAPRVLTCGALLGLASFFTQTRGVGAAVGFAGFFIWDGIQTQATMSRRIQQLSLLLLALIVTWLVLSSYFIFKLGIGKLFYFQAIYVMQHVTHDARNLYPEDNNPLLWPIRSQVFFFTTPIVYAVSLWQSRKTVTASPGAARPIALLAFVGAGMYAEVAFSPNGLRLDCVVMPALILLVWLLARAAERLPEPVQWRKYALALTWIGLIAQSAHQVWARNMARSQIVDLPAGRVAAEPLKGEKLTWLARHTTPGERFFQASYESLYLPLGLRNPAFDYLDRYTSPEFEALDLRQLTASPVRYILWSPLDRPHYRRFEQFLFQHYRRVWQFSDGDEIWELP